MSSSFWYCIAIFCGFWHYTDMTDIEYLTPKEVAEKLRIHERTVRRLLSEGSLPGVRVGSKTWRVSAAALKAHIEAGDKTPTPTKKGKR